MDLINKINYFLKLAGMLKFSQKMRDDIIKLVEKNYKIVKKEKLKRFKAIEEIPIYLDDLPESYGLKRLLKDTLLDELSNLQLRINFYSSDKALDFGQFDSVNISINLNIKLTNFNYDKKELKTTVEHELIHFTQFLLSLKLNKMNPVINTEENIEDMTENQINRLKIKHNIDPVNLNFTGYPKGFDMKQYTKHVLDKDYYENIPEEFFTLLHDAIIELKQSKRKSKQYFNEFISGKNCSLDTKKFLERIKYNEKLYQRAIKELYMAYTN